MFKMYSKNHTQQFFSWMHFKTDVHEQGKTPACITSICMYHVLPMAALALLVEHLAAERKVTGSIPRHRPILRVLKSTEK